MRVIASGVTLPFVESFTNYRGSRDREQVVRVELEHEGVVGHAEAAPVTYLGQTQSSMLEFLDGASDLVGDDPYAITEVAERLRAAGPGESAARAAVEGALHDWIGRRLGLPTWRLLGLGDGAPPTSYTVSIDSVEGTVEQVRRHSGFRVFKLKVGGRDDVERIRGVRSESDAAIRIDANEGWTLDDATEVMPKLVELGVEFLEEPLPRHDLDGYLALRRIEPRVPIVIDEGCQDLRSVARVATYADGISVKIEKAGGLAEALRMVHAARALGLGVMVSCMLQSQLGVAQPAQLASLVDWADLDGHFLVADRSYRGLRYRNGRVLASAAPGLGIEHDGTSP
jgi:L-alanine-DL-glutamate epimerase-like enolase superfamily enzyme